MCIINAIVEKHECYCIYIHYLHCIVLYIFICTSLNRVSLSCFIFCCRPSAYGKQSAVQIENWEREWNWKTVREIHHYMSNEQYMYCIYIYVSKVTRNNVQSLDKHYWINNNNCNTLHTYDTFMYFIFQ